MLEMECQKCGRGIKWWPGDLFDPSGDKRVCPHCMEQYELGNPAICSILNGLIFASLMVGMTFIGLRYQWVRVVAAGLVSWFIHPFLVAVFGRWHSRSYRAEDSGKARIWVIVGAISGWIFGVAVVFTAICFGFLYRDLLIMGLDFAEGGEKAEAIDEFVSGLKFRVAVGVGVAFMALVFGAIASLMRGRLQDVELQEG